MSVFDPETFMSAEITGALDTTLAPVPEGAYPAIVSEFKLREVEGRDGSPRYPCEIQWEIVDDNLKIALGRDKVTVRQTVWLDLTATGLLDNSKGKNIGLGKIRQALSQNDPNTRWSLNSLRGAGPALVEVKHRPDKNDPSVIYAEVSRVGTYK